MVRARFKLTEIHELSWGGKRLVFAPEYDSTIAADRCFAKATPTGRFEMQVDNKAALEQFKLGEDYFVDFTPAKATPEAEENQESTTPAKKGSKSKTKGDKPDSETSSDTDLNSEPV